MFKSISSLPKYFPSIRGRKILYFLLCGLIKSEAFKALEFGLEVAASLQQNRDFARKEELKRFYERKKEI